MVDCPDCDARFDTERGLEIHRRIDHHVPEDVEDPHGEGGIGALLVDSWRNPRFAFLLGALVGVLLVGTVVFSAPSAFLGDSEEQIAANVVHHYESRAPPTATYELGGIDRLDTGMYAVTLEVTAAGTTTEETVYVTPDGTRLFESPPQRVQADIGSLSGSD